MRVALVHDWLVSPGGSENVFKEICEMFPEGVVFTPQANLERLPFLKRMEVRTSYVQHLPFAMKRHFIYAPLMPSVFRRMDLREFDVVLVDSHSFAHFVRPRKDALFICYYHTVARSLWVPEIDQRASTGKLAWLKKRLADKLRPMDFEAAQRPDVRYANSHTTAERVENFYKTKVDQVINPPVDTKLFGEVERVSEEDGLLIWGRLIPYKRMDLAILAAKLTGEKLQIVGDGPNEQELRDLAAGDPKITFHGRLSDADLMKLMGRCKAVIFPNYEDFGIVPVEAMSAGLPVLVYAEGGGKETVPPECGVHFHEQTPEALAQAIRELSTRTFDPAHLKAHAAQFDTARFRSEYKTAVDQAIQKHFSKLACEDAESLI